MSAINLNYNNDDSNSNNNNNNNTNIKKENHSVIFLVYLTIPYTISGLVL